MSSWIFIIDTDICGKPANFFLFKKKDCKGEKLGLSKAQFHKFSSYMPITMSILNLCKLLLLLFLFQKRKI